MYDVFGMIPAPSEKDGVEVQKRYETIQSGQSEGLGGNKYYGYEENLYAKVKQTFTDLGVEVDTNNVTLIQGLYEDTLKVDEPVAMAHIDCDWYDSVMVCLNQIVPHLSVGGILVIDDYGAWAGCKKAVDEYFKDRLEFEFMMKSRLHIRKKS